MVFTAGEDLRNSVSAFWGSSALYCGTVVSARLVLTKTGWLSLFPLAFLSFFFFSFALTPWEDSSRILPAYKKQVSPFFFFFQRAWQPKRPSRVTTHPCALIVSRSDFHQLLSRQSARCVFLHARAPDALVDSAQSGRDLWRLLGPQSERPPQDSGQCDIKHTQHFPHPHNIFPFVVLFKRYREEF